MPLAPESRPADYLVILGSVFNALPFEGDDTENETILKFALKLYQAEQETCVKYMDKIAQACVKVIADEKTADIMEPKFKREVGKFLLHVVMKYAQGTLQQMEASMTNDEKSELQKYMC